MGRNKDGELPHKDDGEIRGHAMGINVKDFLEPVDDL